MKRQKTQRIIMSMLALLMVAALMLPIFANIFLS